MSNNFFVRLGGFVRYDSSNLADFTETPVGALFSGAGAPDNAVGIDGDRYVRTAGTTGIYGKSGGTWSLLVGLAAGDQGVSTTDSPTFTGLGVSTEQFAGNLRPGLIAAYNGGISGSLYRLGMVYSQDGIEWARDARNPILALGSGGTFDSAHQKDPCLLNVGGKLYLYYSGHNGSVYRIGLATSDDFGQTWTRYTGAGTGGSVIDHGTSGKADDAGCAFPVVIYEPTATASKRWKMWYRGTKSSDSKSRIRYAYSADGLSWTKFAGAGTGDSVLDLGSAGQFDDNLLETGGFVLNIGATYYYWYGGNKSTTITLFNSSSRTNTRWTGGLVTFTDPEGTYTRQGQVLAPLDTRERHLTANLTLGSSTVTVADTTCFQAGEPVVLADTAVTAIQFNYIQSIDSGTQITLRHACPVALTTANGAVIRSVFAWSVEPRSVWREDGRWVMAFSAFQATLDVSGFLYEATGFATNTNTVPTGAWTIDLARGVMLQPRASTSQWDTVSQENVWVLPLRYSPGPRLPEVLAHDYRHAWSARRWNPRGIASFTATGRVSTTASSATITGSGTQFTKELAIGDRVTVNGETYAVTAVASDTSATAASTFVGSNSGVAMTIAPCLTRWDNSAGTMVGWVDAAGTLNLTGALLAGRLSVPAGATLPGSATTGELYLHTPTGRTILHQYDGSSWVPLYCYGAATVYVDGTSGTDAVDKGGSTGSGAFATIQYAVNRMAPLFSGTVTINVSAGTYREQVTILGFYPKGDVRLIIKGTLSVTTSGTATSASNAGPGTLTDSGKSWTTNAYRGLKVKITGGTGSGQEKMVQANDATSLTIVGKWNTTPDATSTYEVYARDTRVTGSNAGADTTAVRSYGFLVQSSAVEIHDLKINYCTLNGILFEVGAVTLGRLRNVEVHNSSSSGIVVRGQSTVTIRLVHAYSNVTSGVSSSQGSMIFMNNTLCRANTGSGLLLTLAGKIANQATMPDGEASGGNCLDGNSSHGAQLNDNSLFNGVSTGTGMFSESKNNGGWGVFADTGSFGKNVQAWTYSGNTSGTYTPTTAPSGGTN